MEYQQRLLPSQRFENALKDHTNYSYFAGDVDTSVISRTANYSGRKSEKTKLNWKDFKAEAYESNQDEEAKKEKVSEIVSDNFGKFVNLANYIIEEPQICHTTDRLRKVCDLFRHMQLRQLPVINPQDGKLVGIITRQDIFSFMQI